jgi:hypothetical protein
MGQPDVGSSVRVWQRQLIFVDSECMSPIVTMTPRREPRFLWLFLGKVVLLMAIIVVVWALYAYLHAHRLDWLGSFYAKLLPLTPYTHWSTPIS